MRLEANQMNAFRRTACVTSVAILLLVLALSAGAAHAAPGAMNAGTLAINVQQSVAAVFAGPIAMGNSRVIIPARPTPRSPFQPPTWLPSTPPWSRPTPPTALRSVR